MTVLAACNVALEIFGILVALLILLSCMAEGSIKDRQIRLFVIMLGLSVCLQASDMAVQFLDGNAAAEAISLALTVLFYVSGNFMAAVFMYYVREFAGPYSPAMCRLVGIMNLLCTVSVAMVLLDPVTKIYFSFENGIYIRGPLFWMSQIVPLIILLFNAITVICQRKLRDREKLSLLSYCLSPIIACVVQFWFYGLTLLGPATILSLLIIYGTIHTNRAKELAEQKTELTEAQVAVMLSQIQPHFLYNTLANIRALCRRDSQRACEAIDCFSGYLRENMAAVDEKRPIPFERELAHVNNYLQIEKMRFDERLHVEYHLPVTDFKLPALSVQTLVENAVKHGIRRKDAGGTVWITTREDARTFQVEIRDDGVGFDTELPLDNTHIGLRNTRHRLSAMCDGSLRVESTPGIGTTVTITLPKGDA